MIEIAVFDDMVLPEIPTPDGRGMLIPQAVVLCGVQEDVRWHQEFNALGPWAIDVKKHVKMDNQADFDVALQVCKNFSGRAICFFDYTYVGVRISKEHIESVGELALDLVGTRDISEAVNHFNSDRHGLLLAAAMVAHAEADVDIWLGSGVDSEVVYDAKALQRAARPGVHVERMELTLARTREVGQRIKGLQRAIDEYVRARDLPDPGIWTPLANGSTAKEDWFRDRSCPVPHSQPKPAPEELVVYLGKLGLSKEIACKWLNSSDFYETLKYLVGVEARAHVGGEKELSLGSLLIALLLSTGPGEWARDIEWRVTTTSICDAGILGSRALVLRAIRLFEAMHKIRNSDKRFLVRARFEKKVADGTHLLVDFGPDFDCSIGKSNTAASLLARCQILGVDKPIDGSTTGAIHDFLVAGKPARGSRKLYFSLYPVEQEGGVWTRLDFKASA